MAGVLVSAATLPGIALAPVIGVLADRYGRREVLVPCLILFGLSGGAAAFAPNFWVLGVLRFVQGAGSAGLINLAVVIIGDHWEGTERARMVGRNAAVLTVSLAVLPTLGGGLTDLGSWRTPFLIYPVALVTAVVVARRLPRGVRRDVRLSDQLASAIPVLRRPEVGALLAASVVVFALIFGYLLTAMPVLIEERFGIGASWRGVILGLPALGSTGGALALGWLLERVGRRRPLVVASVLLAIALAVFAGSSSLPLIIVGIIVFGLGEGGTVPSIQDLAAGASDSNRGATVAVQVSAARTGQTIGPLAVSAAYGAVGPGVTFAAGAVLAIAVLLPLLWRAAAVEGPD